MNGLTSRLSDYIYIEPSLWPAITDASYYGQNPDPRTKAIEVWLENTPAITDSHYYGITDTFVVPK